MQGILMTSFFSDKLSGKADTGRYCQCLVQNTSHRLARIFFHFLRLPKKVNGPILAHFIL